MTLDEVRALLRERITERLEAAGTYRRLEQRDRADELEREAAVIASHVEGPA